MRGAWTIMLSQAPPTTNKLFLNVKGVGRVKTPEYKAWLDVAGWDLLDQPKPKDPIGHRVVVVIDVQDGASRADADNLAKPLVDLLVRHRILGGDSPKYVKRVSCGYEDDVAPSAVRVTLLKV